jgi:hypothetical protein
MFKDSKGMQSTMRLLSVICVISGIAYAFVFRDIAISGMLIGYGMGGKLIQKQLEK